MEVDNYIVIISVI